MKQLFVALLLSGFLISSGHAGQDSIPDLVQALKGTDIEASIVAAKRLGEIKAESTAQVLLEQLLEIVPRGIHRTKRTKRRLAYAIRNALQQITGQTFPLRPRLFQQQVNLKRIVDWWNSKLLSWPRQYDESIDIDKPTEEQLREWRYIKW